MTDVESVVAGHDYWSCVFDGHIGEDDGATAHLRHIATVVLNAAIDEIEDDPSGHHDMCMTECCSTIAVRQLRNIRDGRQQKA